MDTKKALIIGGGIAGSVIAMFLKRAGFDPVIYEAQPAAADEDGFCMGLSPNGMRILRDLGIYDQITASGSPTTGIVFYNYSGKRIGEVNTRDAEQRYGAASIVIKRGHLHTALREAAAQHAIPVEFGKQLTDLQTKGQTVIAHFADGSSAEGDFLIGSDGIHSRTRQLMLPDAPKPTYTGVINCSGLTRSTTVSSSPEIHLILGRRGLFGYFALPSGEIHWFSNLSHTAEPAKGELDSIPQDAWRKRLLEWHWGDPSRISEMIRSTADAIGTWATYDLPYLPTWHTGRIGLIGDAAHAASPHFGQGASIAMEDAMVLAKCLRDIDDVATAFCTYEHYRKGRAEKMVIQARRTGSQKAVSNRLMDECRNQIMALSLKMGARATTEIYNYRVDWNKKMVAATR